MFFINLILQTLIMTGVSSQAYPEPCLLRCKDNYMNRMQRLMTDSSTEWSLNLVTPLQNLFQHSSSESVRPKVEMACRSHDEFLRCLNKCHPTSAQSALLDGQESWATICHAFRTDDEFSNFILPCWADHGDELSQKCHIHALMVQNTVVDMMHNGINDIQNNLADLCRTITIYDKCYIWQTDLYCGEKAWRFLLSLNQKSSMALIKLLSDNSLIDQIPETCQQWTSPSKYAQWHADRISAFKNSAPKIKSVVYIFAGILISLYK